MSQIFDIDGFLKSGAHLKTKITAIGIAILAEKEPKEVKKLNEKMQQLINEYYKKRILKAAKNKKL